MKWEDKNDLSKIQKGYRCYECGAIKYKQDKEYQAWVCYERHIICPKCGVVHYLSPALVEPESIRCSCGVNFERDVEIVK